MTKKVRKAVFPVGGLGTRFLPATKAMPKEMLPVVDKPLIQYAVEEARAAGIEQFIFVTGRGKGALEDHFDHSYELEDTLRAKNKAEFLDGIHSWLPTMGEVVYTRQMQPNGLGHAVQCARHIVGDEPFAVLLADDLILSKTAVLKQMVDAHAEVGGNVIAVMEVPHEHTKRYGVLTPGKQSGKTIEVKGLVEKPDPSVAPSNYAVIGRYILDASVFAELDHVGKGAGGEIQLTDGLARMIGKVPFHGFSFEGTRFDCGDKIGFLHANMAFALDRADIRKEFADVLRQVAGTL